MRKSHLRIQTSLACWPASSQLDAVMHCLGAPQEASPETTDSTSSLSEPLWGHLYKDHVQLVPQSRGLIDEQLCAFLKQQFPNTMFRLHANARVQPTHKIIDLADFGKEDAKQWFADAARISKALGATAYSAHSGQRKTQASKTSLNTPLL